MQIRDLLTEKRLRHLEEMVAEISPQTLHSKIENGESFQLLEISHIDDYQSGHINGAVCVPLSEVESYALKHFRRFQQIVVYCTEASSNLAIIAARKLQRAGFTNVLVLRGGKEAWKNEGYLLVD